MGYRNSINQIEMRNKRKETIWPSAIRCMEHTSQSRKKNLTINPYPGRVIKPKKEIGKTTQFLDAVSDGGYSDSIYLDSIPLSQLSKHKKNLQMLQWLFLAPSAVSTMWDYKKIHRRI